MALNMEHVATQEVGASNALAFVLALWSRASRSLHSALCGIHGHDPLLQVHNRRIFLKCTTCGHETPGWSTSERGPQLRYTGDHARHRLN
jgi:hypothetical protein